MDCCNKASGSLLERARNSTVNFQHHNSSIREQQTKEEDHGKTCNNQTVNTVMYTQVPAKTTPNLHSKKQTHLGIATPTITMQLFGYVCLSMVICLLPQTPSICCYNISIPTMANIVNKHRHAMHANQATTEY